MLSSNSIAASFFLLSNSFTDFELRLDLNGGKLVERAVILLNQTDTYLLNLSPNEHSLTDGRGQITLTMPLLFVQ